MLKGWRRDDAWGWHAACIVEIAMSTREKQEAYLAATAKVSRSPGRVFNLIDVCRCLKWDRTECETVSMQLEKAGLLNRLPNDEGILTSAGMARAKGAGD